MIKTITRSRQKTRVNPTSLPVLTTRLISKFFKHNLDSLFESHEKNGQKAALDKVIEPVRKVVPTYEFYKQQSKSSRYPTLNILNESQSSQIVPRLIANNGYGYYDGLRNRPEAGSLVEIQRDDGTVDIGVVQLPQSGLFHEDLEVLTMLNIKGKIIHFKANQVSFHLFKLINPEILTSTNLEQSKAHIVQFLHHFISSTQISKYNDRSLYAMAQAWFAKENSPVEVDLGKMVGMIQRYSNQQKDNLLGESTSIFAAHQNLTNDPINWMVIRTPIPSHNYSLVHYKYYSNSYKTIENLEVAMKLNDVHLITIADELKSRLKGDTECNDIRFMNSVISLMEHYVAYPHTGLRPPLRKIWNHLQGSFYFEVSDIQEILVKLGRVNIFNTIEPSRTNQIYSKINPDHFEFLREPANRKAYTIPNPNGDSELAISLEKTHGHWIFQVHVLDIGSRISPSSKLADVLQDRVTTLECKDETLELLDKGLFSGLKNSGANHAITLTIQYPLDQTFGWEKAKLLSLDLTNLHSLQTVSIDEINQLAADQNEFLSFFRTRKGGLNSEDEDTLTSCMRIIEINTRKRSNQGALSFRGSPKTVIDDELVDFTDLGYIEYLRKELSYIVSDFVVQWSEDKKIPLIIHSQSTLPALSDSVKIDPQRFSIPAYEASDYDHFTLFPDLKGDVTLKSFVCGQQYLNQNIVSDKAQPFASLGLESGFVNFANPLNDFESIVNQWQVINCLKQEFKVRQGYNYSFNKSLQSFKSLSAQELQQFYDFKIGPLKNFNRSLQLMNEKFNKLKWLSTRPNEWMIFKCIITKPSKYPNLAQAYCLELDLDVEILLNPTIKNVQIGDQLICTKIVKLDLYIESRIILEL